MRRTERYTIPFPDALPPPPAVYREAFLKFPFWYRWYIRVRSVLAASSVETLTRRHHLVELKRNLSREGRDIIDTNIPALLPRFHHHVRDLISQREAIAPALNEATGMARGTFLKVALADRDATMHSRLQKEIHLTEAELSDPTLSLEEVRQSARNRMETLLLEHRPRITLVLEPIWLSLRSLNVLSRVDLKALLPVMGAKREETPLRVVSGPLVSLYQVVELCSMHVSPAATELALAFARGRIRSSNRSHKGIWIALESVRAEIPLLKIVRYARDEPFLTVPAITLKTDWWTPFAATWIRAAVERSDGELLEHRYGQLLSVVRTVFLVDSMPPVWIPTVLQPKTLGVLILLAGSDLFQDTRRVITQLVIDATFYHLDTRNTLHQMALQLDQALERLTGLLGNGETRGTMGEEIQRLQQRSGPSSIVHRQLSTVYERHRPRIRAAVDECIDALNTAGAIIARNLEGREHAFELSDFHGKTFSGDHPPRELLDLVAAHWQTLGGMIQGLLDLELSMSTTGGGRRRD
jgi:hypothetical protein